MTSPPASTTAPAPAPPVPSPAPAGLPIGTRVLLVALSLVVIACCSLPYTWYTRADTNQPFVWVMEVTNAPGWKFTSQSVDKSAESILAADALLYGEFVQADGRAVRLFTAKRFEENPNAIGLFVHTPDRCWTESGWRIEPVYPDFLETDAGGVRVGIERRLFVHPQGGRELVYFFGLLGGQALPYRLDHNLGVGQRLRGPGTPDGGTALRASDKVLWRRVWDSFLSRRRLYGPKEFVRLSTSVTGADLTSGDEILRQALGTLLAARPVGTEAPRGSETSATAHTPARQP